MITIRSNISDVVRAVDKEKKAVLKDIGDSLSVGIWDEFIVLLNETAQWSGSTAASWNLSMGGDSSVRIQPERTRKEALAKGHLAAVHVAIAHNFKSLIDISDKYRYSAIVIENHAPGASRAETGPLRSVNNPSQAFERFKKRLKDKTFKLIRSRKI